MEEVRYKGLRKDDGKVIKGTMTEAPLKLKASSIPAKTQTVIYSNHHRAAFGNSQQRFYIPNHQKQSITPGPGKYKLQLNSSKIDSKKGSGGFASQTQLGRFDMKRNWNPGPGRYEAAKKMQKSRTTVYLSAQLQRQELFKSQIDLAKKMPGPGKYDRRSHRAFTTTTRTVFQSKTPRIVDKMSENPPLGWYHWEDPRKKVVALKFSKHETPLKHRGQEIHSKYVDSLMEREMTARTQSNIGPGKYDPSPFKTKRAFSIRQNNRDRFGEVKPTTAEMQATTTVSPSDLGKDPMLPSKKISDHEFVFKSKVGRYQFGAQESKTTGQPAKYSPSKMGKNSHHINFSNHWV